MKSWHDAIERRAGLLAFAAGAVVFGLISVVKPTMKKSPVMVPVVKRFVAEGSHIQAGDIRWVSQDKLRPVQAKNLRGFAKVPLFPGQVLSVKDVGQFSQTTVVVAVSPTQRTDTGVARVGGYVDVVVLASDGVRWKSGPLPVVRKNGSGAGVDVAMRMPEALTFEKVKAHATIDLVGLTS